MDNKEYGGELNTPGDIRGGSVVVGGVEIQFDERCIIDNKLYMIIPSHFKPMPPEVAKIKYSAENRPHLIFTDASGLMTVNFSLTGQELKAEETKEAKEGIQSAFESMNPSFGIIASAIVEAQEVPIGYFDFISPIADDEIYNRIFLFSLENRLVMGSINCLREDMDKWVGLFEQMLSSIKV